MMTIFPEAVCMGVGFVLLALIVAGLISLLCSSLSGFLRASDKGQSAPPPPVRSSPQPVWQDAEGGMRRIEVPGGWIYKVSSAYGPTMTFVPKPTELQEPE